MSNPTGPQDPYGPQDPNQQPGGYGAQPPAYGNQQGGASMGEGYSAPPPPPNYYGGGTTGPQFPDNTAKNNLGVWALVLGILGVVCCGFLAGIPAIILGNKSKQAAAQGLATNGNLGQIGLVLGWVAVALGVINLILAGTGFYDGLLGGGQF
jgi:hypothetical protein